ncbi:hypothetical protein GOODEAATRI_028387 [Goodea atripinnis]|uniref:Uncharacterized protein n=1 Tax=Goodea atripinnis TaxID=208336 RepID=A0ABV0NYE9_9TELE
MRRWVILLLPQTRNQDRLRQDIKGDKLKRKNRTESISDKAASLLYTVTKTRMIQTHQVQMCRSFHRASKPVRCRINSVHHPPPGNISVVSPVEAAGPFRPERSGFLAEIQPSE